MAGSLSFQLLGSVAGTYDGQPLALGGAKQRAVLAALLYDPRRVRPTEDIITDVWGTDTGIDPGTVFQYVSRLKTVLATTDGRARIVSHRGRGYQIVVSSETVDWLRFRVRLDRARASRLTEPSTALADLREAVGLWQGPALDDLGGHTLAEVRDHMSGQYAAAVDLLAQLELDHGDPAAVVDRLERLAADHPDREHTAALLVRTLRMLGRRGDATGVYQRARAHAVTAFGLDTATELEDEYAKLLDTTPPTAAQRAAAAGIRAPSRHFVGRETELGQLVAVLTGEEAGNVVAICAVDGMAGIGKTELAYHLIYRTADRFPDGIYDIDLLGWTPGHHPLTPADALDRLLRRLGIPGPAIPPSLEDRAALYRMKLADKRALVLLDNARNSAQIQPLLPSAPGCRVIVTGRRRFTALDEAWTLHLDVLSPDAALDLFVQVAALVPTAEDRTVLARIGSRCGHLPLAIRTLAARYRQRAWADPTALEAALNAAHSGLDLLDDDDGRSVTAAFNVSFQSLPSDQQRLFRLLGLIPGAVPTATARSAAVLAGVSVTDASRLLGRLVEASLLTRSVPGRCGMHDLLHDYATGLAAEMPKTERHAAATRLLDYYADTTTAATDLVYPYDTRRTDLVSPFTGKEEAEEWLDFELPNLLAAADHAAHATHAARDWAGHTMHQSAVLHRHLRTRGHYREAETLHEQALRLARKTGSHGSELNALLGLGDVHRVQGRSDEATTCYRQALELAGETGRSADEQSALLGLGDVHRVQGRSGEAATCYHQVLELAREAGSDTSEQHALIGLGHVHRIHGRHEPAIDCFRRALRIARQIGHRSGEQGTLRGLGHVHRWQGQYDQAADCYRQALELAREGGHRTGELYALHGLGDVHRARLEYEQAADHYQQVLSIAQDIGNRNGQCEALDGLGRVHLATGRHPEALSAHHAALALATELDQPDDQARAHDGLARIHRSSGADAAARDHWQTALDLLTRHGIDHTWDPQVTTALLRSRLGELDRQTKM
jgi:tetratricopeptide (TPR) repeat protein